MLCRTPTYGCIAVAGCVVVGTHIYLQCLEAGIELKIQCLHIPTLHNNLLKFGIALKCQCLVVLPECVVRAGTVFIQFEDFQIRHILQRIE